jgi:hypothetical protein
MTAYDIAPETGGYEDASLEEQVVYEICAESALSYEPNIFSADADLFLARTCHLTLEENGALVRLLMTMELSEDHDFLDKPGIVARILGCSKNRWLSKLAPVVIPLIKDGVGDVS